jgi:tripartite motif-containing protein 2/3
MDCKSRNIIYLITCKKCHIQYVGETGNPLHTRMNAHRYNILNKKPTAIGIHFNSPQHSIAHLSVMPIEKLQDHNNVTKRHGREYYWQKELHTQFPKGLNNFPIDKPQLFQQLHINSIADLEIFWALNSAETQQIV